VQPLVSVFMPAYNAAGTIGPAIRSILSQTYENFELIVVDDGSSDSTASIVESFDDPRIVLVANPCNLKVAISLNIAIDLARGSYFARSDADDLSMPGRFQAQVEYLEAHPEVDALGTAMYFFNAQGEIIGGLQKSSDHGALVRRMQWRIPIAQPTMMARAEWLRRYKYRPLYFRAEDRDLFFRSFRESRFANMPQYLYAYRDPGRINLKKIYYTNYQVLIMRLRHWKEYGLPIRWVLGFPLIMAGRLVYYVMTAALGRSWLWSHMQPLPRTTALEKDQVWLSQCLQKG
jgi:glycosyltransferase involved in cell wall biosynthesis